MHWRAGQRRAYAEANDARTEDSDSRLLGEAIVQESPGPRGCFHLLIEEVSPSFTRVWSSSA